MFQKFNPEGQSFERKMYEGDWTCSDCGAKITSLPFQPAPDRPILCRECHAKKRQSFGR
ncbi:MAG: DNA-directed RNA polymerase [bacterium]|nr:DNA-directed RNA polymerase [bacterium]